MAASLRSAAAIPDLRLILTDTKPSWWRVTAKAGGALDALSATTVAAVATASPAVPPRISGRVLRAGWCFRAAGMRSA